MRAVRPVAAVAGRCGYLLLGRRRSLVESHLARVLGERPSESLVKAAFVSYCRYWIEALRLPVLTTDALDDLVEFDGFEHLEKALEGGKGAIAVVPHIGNWDVLGAWVAAHDMPITVVMERLEPHDLFVWFRDFRSGLGLSVAVNGPRVGVELLAALRRNEIIALLSDRDVDGTGLMVDFFGEPAKVPRGPAALALRSGAPLFSAVVYEKGNKYLAVIDPPVLAERSGSTGEDIERVTRQLVVRMEEQIRSAPEQWHLFTPNWPSDR